MRKRRKQLKQDIVLFLVFILITNSFVHGQVINSSNEFLNGKKKGAWMEYSYMNSIEINGERRLILRQKSRPQFSIQEGQYNNGERHGIWKTYWTDEYLDSNKIKFQEGPLYEIIEYDRGTENGPYSTFFKSGGIMIRGNYSRMAYQSIDTIQLIDQETEAIRDTVITSEYSSKMVGVWQEYDEEGNLINSKDYQEAEKKNDSATAKLSITKFIPEGYSLLDSATGDLNLDAYPDMLLVLKKNGEDSTSDIVDHQEKRPLLILTGQADKQFKLSARNDNTVYCVNCGGMMGDPYMGIVIKKGYFSIEHYGGSAWRWTRIITYKYSTAEKYWYLHKDGGDSFHTSDPDKVETKIRTTKEFGKVRFEQFNLYTQ
jgi:hypothetical protein